MQPSVETTLCDLSHRRTTTGTSWGRRSQLPRKHGQAVIARPLREPPPQASEDEDDHMRKSGVVWRSSHPRRWAARKRSHRCQRYLKRLIVQKICVRSKRRDSPNPTFPPGLWMELYLVIGEAGIYTTCCIVQCQCKVVLGSCSRKEYIVFFFFQIQLFVGTFDRFTRSLQFKKSFGWI